MPLSAKQASLLEGLGVSAIVANYDTLPDPTTVPDKFYWCEAAQGSKWNPISGSYKSAGMYYSNGSIWEYMAVPYQAIQSDVNAGIVTDQFVSPNTFTNASKWSTKQDTLAIGNLSDVGTDGIIISNGGSSVIGTGTTISQHIADTTHNGYLGSTDWNTFNNKQVSGNYITALTGDITASGPGSSIATLSTILSVLTKGSASKSATITSDVKGRITALSDQDIQIAESQVTNLTTDLASRQSTLVSGTNIKTVNSNSLLGSGNISVGDALVANSLSQFASTTSEQLRGVLSDENGTGAALFDSSISATFITPVLGIPTSGILTNCTGYTEANLSLTDITTNNVTTTKHGLVPKLPNDGTKYLDGTGVYSIPATTQGNLTGAITSIGLATSLGSFSSANLVTALTDETGTGVAVFGTAPTFTTNITTPFIIGGTAAGSFIKYESTTGTGTTAGIAHEYWGGTNGGTNLFNVYNDAQFLVNTTTRNSTSLGIFRVGQGTSMIDIGEVSSGVAAIWGNNATPSTTNYLVKTSGTSGTLNGSSSADIRVLNVVKANFGVGTIILTPGAATSGAAVPLTYTAPGNTGQTAGTEVNGVLFDLSATLQHASNTAVTTQRAFLIKAPTYSFASATGTITTAATLAIDKAPVVGTNAAITNSYAFWVQAGLTRLDGGISGVTDASSAAAGVIGEVISSTISTYTNYTTTATYQNITSIALTPGDWEIRAFGTLNSNTATITAASNCIFVVSTTTASAAGATEGLNISYIPQAALVGTSKESTGSINMPVTISSNTTYYLNTQATFTLGNPQYVGTIYARRIR